MLREQSWEFSSRNPDDNFISSPTRAKELKVAASDTDGSLVFNLQDLEAFDLDTS